MNGENQDDSDIGKLMHDFACANPEKIRYYKNDEINPNPIDIMYLY